MRTLLRIDRRTRSAHLFALLVPALLLSPAMMGCGSGNTGIGAVNSMPNRASDKAISKAENCDDGNMKACNWVGIWFMIGGAGKDRKSEGKRFLRHACKQGYRPSCKLANALNRRRPSRVRPRTMQRAEAALPYSAPQKVRTVARRCDSGNLKSCHSVGAWLLLGKGDTPGKKRRVPGLKIISRNCKRGYQPSCKLIRKLKEMLREKKQQQQQQGSI